MKTALIAMVQQTLNVEDVLMDIICMAIISASINALLSCIPLMISTVLVRITLILAFIDCKNICAKCQKEVETLKTPCKGLIELQIDMNQCLEECPDGYEKQGKKCGI